MGRVTNFGGSRKGWLVESFFPSAEDLREVLEALQPKLLVTNTRVPSNYSDTPLDDWLRAYRRYVARVISGKPVTWRLLDPLYISLTDPKLRVYETPLAGLPFKLLEFKSPLIDLSPLRLTYDSGRLSLALFNTDDASAFGLNITFPRTSATKANSQLYQDLCAQLRQRSHPCVFQSGQKQFRPRFYLSNRFGSELNQHAYLRQCNLHVKMP